MNYARFLTHASQLRQPSVIREATKKLAQASKHLVFLGGGFPNPQTFPFEDITVTVENGAKIEIKKDLLDVALQYSPTLGYPTLVKQLKNIVEQIHAPPRMDKSEVIVTTGSQDGLARSIEMLVNPRDYFLIHIPAYTGTLSILEPLQPKFLPIETDADGVIPKSLAKILSKWHPATIRQDVHAPKVLYINPNAINPSGTSLTGDRRKEIYEIACKYDLMILEDDPYYFIQFCDDQDYAPSFLSLDQDGRVLRFDSFSKLLSSGIRVGFVTGPAELIKRIELHMQSSVLHTSTLSQVTVSELLKVWGEEGLQQHIQKVKKFYSERRDVMLAAAEKHLKGLCRWSVPCGGMFVWLECLVVEDTTDMLVERGISKDIMMIPGRYFYTDQQAKCNKMRASFSIASSNDIDRGFRNLAQLIREEVELQNSQPRKST